MFVMRDDLADSMRQEAKPRFATFLAEYLVDNFPELFPERNDDVDEFAHYAIDVAHAYGIESDHAVFQYTHLMILLGPDFDEDPELPWAREILLNEELDEDEAIEQLATRGLPAEEPKPASEA